MLADMNSGGQADLELNLGQAQVQAEERMRMLFQFLFAKICLSVGPPLQILAGALGNG